MIDLKQATEFLEEAQDCMLAEPDKTYLYIGYALRKLKEVSNTLAEFQARERAAVESLRKTAIFNNSCGFCIHNRDCSNQNSSRETVEPCWEWRGVQKTRLTSRSEGGPSNVFGYCKNPR